MVGDIIEYKIHNVVYVVYVVVVVLISFHFRDCVAGLE